jgi:ribosomal-protein-alanine N-acetyltransferase
LSSPESSPESSLKSSPKSSPENSLEMVVDVGVNVAKAGRNEAHPILITQRLRLRCFAQRDLGGLHACFGDPEAMRYWNFPPTRSQAESARWLKILQKSSSHYTFLAWAVADKGNDQCIGMVNYHHREAQSRRLDVGYILAPAWQGKGLMTEAMGALLAYLFEDLAVRRVQALIHPDNAASIRLAKRLKFRCEGGPLRDYWRVEDRYMSVMVYALLSGER